ncbi:WD40/YVTN/BNR-like repeat-containing protein [Natronosalvus halobius]|uniref:WD40/YVTN/BNR-like repeat-containing protein n=1 Tax=Natronosalvus halobius TaxID=2953746 RepID=UPI00209D7F85|nr:glycosyl hydrolase [Natronosalvus halobius]USZ73487.1 glycosyl hydrolase [Natronosalvus halobius]
MTLHIATQDGVYRSQRGDLDDVERVLDSGVTLGVQSFDEHGTFVTSKTGLYRSTASGSTWDRLDVPRPEVYAVTVSPDGTRLYAGTHPAHLYVSTDEGSTWTELDGFQELPSRDRWHTPRHRGESHVRSLGVSSDAPNRVVAGVEVGGVHVSDDNGETWTERRDDLQTAREDDLQYDVHHLLVVSSDEYVASCGGGLYRTRDTGYSWTRLDTGLNQSYFQEAFAHRGTLYAAAQTLPPTLPAGSRYRKQDVDAALFESTDGGDTFEAKSYPGAPDEFICAWTAVDGRVLAGTTEGRVIIRDDGTWTSLGYVPNWIRSLSHGSGE